MLTSGYGVLLLFTVLIILAVIQLIVILKLKSSLMDKKDFSKEDNETQGKPIDTSNKEEKSKIIELKSQLKSKTIELAKSEKDSEEKNRLLSEIKEKIEQCVNNPDSVPRFTKDVLQMLDSAIIHYDSTFGIQIDELHQEFSMKLKDKHPDLTTHDLRLATYIKLGLNAKEIAELLNIKPSSVYISRSRFRKKLDLDTDADLHSYLNTI